MAMSDSPRYYEIMTQAIELYLFEPWDNTTRDQIEEEFRRLCPGPYQFVWESGLDAEFMPKFRLELDDSPEATEWMLKWA